VRTARSRATASGPGRLDPATEYRVLLTRLDDCPLGVAAKTATFSTVPPTSGEGCSIACDFRILARPQRMGDTRMAVHDNDLGPLPDRKEGPVEPPSRSGHDRCVPTGVRRALDGSADMT